MRKRKASTKFKALLLILAMASFVILDRRFFIFALDPPKWPQKFKQYELRDKGVAEESPRGGLSLRAMPDISLYSTERLQAKIPPIAPGSATLSLMKDGDGVDKFSELRRLAEFSAIQGRGNPWILHLNSGVYDLAALSREISDPDIMLEEQGVFVLRVPLYIAPAAALVIRGEADRRAVVRLSQTRGAFLVNRGKLFILDAEIAGWNESKKDYAAFSSKKKFRPFITSWSGSETYMGRSNFFDLGYFASKSYGVSFSSAGRFAKNLPRPTGWIIDCRFERLYYGFYSYEADDVAIIGNIYYDNIIYGIDPHDRSNRLVIANNIVHGTRRKHGIIISREVNDGWIAGNRTYGNGGSGIMLDRSSMRNLIADNVSYGNRGDGITIFESPYNVVARNKLFWNWRNGFRARNSWGIYAEKNIMMMNRESGVHIYAQDITSEDRERDLLLDPYTQKASLRMRNSFVLLNKAGAFKFNRVDYAHLSKIEFLLYFPNFMRGELDNLSFDIAYGLARGERAVEITNLAGKPRATASVAFTGAIP